MLPVAFSLCSHSVSRKCVLIYPIYMILCPRILTNQEFLSKDNGRKPLIKWSAVFDSHISKTMSIIREARESAVFRVILKKTTKENGNCPLDHDLYDPW